MEDKVRLGEDTMEEVSAVTEEGIMGLLLLTELAELAVVGEGNSLLSNSSLFLTLSS